MKFKGRHLYALGCILLTLTAAGWGTESVTVTPKVAKVITRNEPATSQWFAQASTGTRTLTVQPWFLIMTGVTGVVSLMSGLNSANSDKKKAPF